MAINFIQTNNKSEGSVVNQFVTPVTSLKGRSKADSIRIILLVILLISIFFAVGMYYYTTILSSRISSIKKDLSEYENSTQVEQFEKNLPEMRTLSKKLKVFSSVFNEKIYPSSILFPIIESSVESSKTSYVYFNKFSLKKDASNSSKSLTNISLSGYALNYQTLYRQVNNFKNGPFKDYISNFKLNNFSEDKDGAGIIFDISFDVDINTISLLKFTGRDTSLENEKGEGAIGTFYDINFMPQNTNTGTTSTTTNMATSTNTSSSTESQNNQNEENNTEKDNEEVNLGTS